MQPRSNNPGYAYERFIMAYISNMTFSCKSCNKEKVRTLLSSFWPCNVVKRGICYENVCPSIYMYVTLASDAYTVLDVEICSAPHP